MGSSRLKIALTLSLATNLVAASGAGYFVHKRGGLCYLHAKLARASGKGRTTRSHRYYHNRVSLFKRLPNRRQDIYLVGDSITDMGEWHELLSAPTARNRRISGDTTAGVLRRLDEVIEGRPAKIFLMCGINNIRNRVPAERTIEEYGAILHKLQGLGTETQIHVQSVLPVNRAKYKESFAPRYAGAHVPKNAEVKALNRSLMALADRYANVRYIDLSRLTDTNGELAAEYTLDGLHLNGAGLIAWAQTIKPFLRN